MGLTFVMSSMLAYSSVYLIERFFWKLSGRERSLKRQFANFATHKFAEMENILVIFFMDNFTDIYVH